MKVLLGSPTTDTSAVNRLSRIAHGVLVRIGAKKDPSPRERYEAAIDSSTITPEQRQKALEHAAAVPGIEAALDEADRAHEQHVKGLESGELRSRPATPSPPRR